MLSHLLKLKWKKTSIGSVLVETLSAFLMDDAFRSEVQKHHICPYKQYVQFFFSAFTLLRYSLPSDKSNELLVIFSVCPAEKPAKQSKSDNH